MQETIPFGMEDSGEEKLMEFFKGISEKAALDAMDERLSELQKTGHRLRQRIMIKVNDPCPCGSGKKYKKCCMDKAR
jgi:uncharacterized protein YchJ